jgi:hypothetical protein
MSHIEGKSCVEEEWMTLNKISDPNRKFVKLVKENNSQRKCSQGEKATNVEQKSLNSRENVWHVVNFL